MNASEEKKLGSATCGATTNKECRSSAMPISAFTKEDSRMMLNSQTKKKLQKKKMRKARLLRS
jgi:hypothetical protein